MDHFIKVTKVLSLFFIFGCLVSESALALDLTYEKELHPSKLEGILSRIQKKWVAQNFALAKITASQNKVPLGIDETISVMLVPQPNKSSSSIDDNELIGLLRFGQ